MSRGEDHPTGVIAELPVASCWNKSYISQNMAAQHTRSFGREAAAVYLAAALVVFGTWAASRYLILRKFENIEQNEVSRSIEVMRKALVTKNTEIETVTRDFARWDDMYSYVSTLDPNFEYQNFSEAGLDEMNVDLVWLLDPEGKAAVIVRERHRRRALSAPGERRGDRRDQSPDAHRAHGARPGRHAAAGADQRRAACHRRAHDPAQRSQRPAAGTLVFARRIARAGNRQHRRRHAAQRQFRDARRSRDGGGKAGTAGRARRSPHPAPLGQRHRRPVAPRHHRQPPARGAVHHAAAHRSCRAASRACATWSAGSRCSISIVVAAWHAYSGRLRRTVGGGGHQRNPLSRDLRSRRVGNRAVRSGFAPRARCESAGTAPDRRLAR